MPISFIFMLIIILIIAAIGIGLIAGAMTYFNTFNEYQHHLDSKKAFRESVKSGSVSFIFFFAITLAIAIILYWLFK